MVLPAPAGNTILAGDGRFLPKKRYLWKRINKSR